jgi:hypothetical protein
MLLIKLLALLFSLGGLQRHDAKGPYYEYAGEKYGIRAETSDGRPVDRRLADRRLNRRISDRGPGHGRISDWGPWGRTQYWWPRVLSRELMESGA